VIIISQNSKHSNISKKGGAYQNSQVCKTTLVKVDRNKYLILDRNKLGTDEDSWERLMAINSKTIMCDTSEDTLPNLLNSCTPV
jgi:hypothetical protein